MSVVERSPEDERYIATQDAVELAALVLLAIDPDDLDSLIARGERSLSLGPILHPSEFRDGVNKLQTVMTHARAIREARRTLEAVLR